jgi:beta-galactosidase
MESRNEASFWWLSVLTALIGLAFYVPGTLKALGDRLGQAIQTTEVHTTGTPAAIRLTADRGRIGTARREIGHVAVEVIDKDGLSVPTANNALKFQLSGAERILGLDDGRPDSHESFQGTEREAFNGWHWLSCNRDGTMTLNVSSDGLTSADVTVALG